MKNNMGCVVFAAVLMATTLVLLLICCGIPALIISQMYTNAAAVQELRE